MFWKPVMVLENSNNFVKGYGITFQNHRGGGGFLNIEYLKNHFEEGF
jgi:hypothetical protein